MAGRVDEVVSETGIALRFHEAGLKLGLELLDMLALSLILNTKILNLRTTTANRHH